MEYKDKNLQEIIDLSELYLSYLLEGNEFILSVKRHNSRYIRLSRYDVSIRRVDRKVFKWSDVKSEYLPFISSMNREYKIEEDVSFSGNRINIDRVVQDLIINYYECSYITFTICI